ncbi:hypothetical protein PAF17_20085, partial [Paracoccus sp. Z330]
MFRRKYSSGVGPEDQKAHYEFGIDPVGFCAGSKAAREDLDLGRPHLAGLDACVLHIKPEPPFRPARSFEAQDGPAVSGEIGHASMTGVIIAYTVALTDRKAVNIEPISAHVY